MVSPLQPAVALFMTAPISVVIPTLNAEAGLSACLTALVPGLVAGLVREVVVADGGSTDGTARIADQAGVRFLTTEKGRGRQLKAGAEAAQGDWLLMLHADTVLDAGWVGEVDRFIAQAGAEDAAAFAFALDSFRSQARRIERLVALRCWLFGLPYGDQGLLVSRALYERVGGFRDLPLMEDVDLVRRIGKRRLTVLKTRAVTSAARYERDGYWRRPLMNLTILSLYFLKVPPRVLARLYG